VIRVAIAAGSPVTRAGLESLVASNPALKLAGSFADLSAVDALRADVVLAAAASGDVPAPAGGFTPAFVLLGGTAAHWTQEALRNGVRALLPETASAGEILSAVEAAGNGLAAVDPADFERLLANAPVHETAAEGESLTPREIEVLRLMAEGAPNKTIAWKLEISEHTVKFHVASILNKLNAGTRTEAVTKGLRRGMILI